MPEGEEKQDKPCPMCQGAIDPKTNTCTVCGIKNEPDGTPEIKSEDDALTRWLSGDMDSINKWIDKEEAKKDEPPAPSEGPAPESSPEQVQDMDVLKRWFTGEEDGSIEEWLKENDADVAVPVEIFAPSPPPPQAQGLSPEKVHELMLKDEEMQSLRAELEATRRELEGYLEQFKKGDFDPAKIVEENVQYKKDIQAEVSKREKMVQDYRDIKRGSIAVIKYLKTHQKAGSATTVTVSADGDVQKLLNQKDEEITALRSQLDSGMSGMPADAQELKKREIATAEKEREIQSKLEELKIREQTIIERDRMGVTASGGEAAEVVKKMQSELAEKDNQMASIQKSLSIRDDEIKDLRNELKMKEDTLQKTSQQLKFKEEELARREQDLSFREDKMSKEAKKLQEASKKIGTMTQQEMEKRLEELQREISMKEAEVRAREKYLSVKSRELELKARGIIDQELDMSKEERAAEMKEEKVKSGTPRLDDLLYGGIPLSSNLLIFGPGFVGKEILLNTFAAEGLKKGVPLVWVLTNKTIKTIREEMQFILPNYMDYEKVGLVKYVDIYSRTIGDTAMESGVIYIDQPTDTAAITDAVDALAKELQKKWHEYYRLVFQSISTIMVRLDPATTFKFLSPFCGKRKRDKAVCLYTIEAGMHSDSDISMIGSMMEGEIDFKTEHEKNYMIVKGVCDVQSRDWIEYTSSKRGLNIKSFSLKLIK